MADKPISLTKNSLPILTNQHKAYLLGIAEKTITKTRQIERNEKFPSVFDKLNNRVFLSVWQDGRKIFSWHSASNNLAASVQRAARKILANAEISSTQNMDYHLHIFGGRKPFDEGIYSQGVHGVSLRNETSSSYYYGAYAIETNFKREKLFERLDKKLENNNSKPKKRFMHNMLHFSRNSDGTMTDFYRANTPNFDVRISQESVKKTQLLMQEWLLNAVKPSGEFNYLYYPSRNEFPSNKNNMIRQLMGSRVLAELAQKNFLYRRKHKENLNFVFNTWYRTDGNKGYIFYKNKSKLGAMAVALRALVYSPYFGEYEKQAAQLSNTILSMTNKDGSFNPWYIAPKYDFDAERLLTFYSGEALLSLVEYARKIDSQSIFEQAQKSQDFYVKKYVDEIDQNYYPAYVPWHNQSLNKLYHITKNKTYAHAVFVMTDKLLELQNTKPNGGDLFGRFYNPATRQYGTPHSSSDAVYTEGVAYAYELAHILEDKEKMERYRLAIRYGVHNIQNLQYRGENMYFVKNKDAVKGGVRINVTDNKVRVDTTQHALDGFLKIDELIKNGKLKF